MGIFRKSGITAVIAALLVLASPLPSRDTTATRAAEVPDTTEVRFDDDRFFEEEGQQRQQLPVSDPNEVTLVRTRRGRVYRVYSFCVDDTPYRHINKIKKPFWMSPERLIQIVVSINH